MKWLNGYRIRLVLVGFVAAIVLTSGQSANADFTFGEPTNLGPTINSPHGDTSGSFSSDGLEMYFDSNRSSGSWGGDDIYVSTRATTDDAWGTPVKLGPPVNSSALDGSPCISANGLLLFFFSNRPGGFGDRDLYMTRRATIDDDWGIPVNLGPTINTSAFDAFATILPDGSTLFFASDRPGGVGNRDLWQAPIIPIVDFNGDEIVDIDDLVVLIDNWGTSESLCDIGPMPWGDGIVDVADLEVLMSYWQQEVEDLTLIAHWKLDEAEGSIAYDSAAVNDGILNGGPLWQPTGGQIDGALAFDGTDDYVSTDFVLNPEDGPFSVFAWIKGGAPGQVILSQTGGANWLLTDPQAGALMIELKGSGRTGGLLLSQTMVTDGDWHRIGLVWDGSYRILYVDGTDVAKDTQAQAYLEAAYGGLYFGAGKDLEPGSFFSGLIDDVRIYDRAITP